MESLELCSLSATERFGAKLGASCGAGDILCLRGQLGAGKTTLTRAIAAGCGVPPEEYVTSPSFALLNIYQGRVPVYHMDFYRLSGSEEVIASGLDEYFHQGGICVIEWYERASELIPEDHLEIMLRITSEMTRRLEFGHRGRNWGQRLRRLLQS